jgi:NADPH:quinone reductase-like Zn-dependent oxidoreductase
LYRCRILATRSAHHVAEATESHELVPTLHPSSRFHETDQNDLLPVTMTASAYFVVDVNTVQLARLADIAEKKEIQTSVGSVLPLVEARAAHQMLGGLLARKPGKIVLPGCEPKPGEPGQKQFGAQSR